jgi:hypothetical protein
MEPMIILSNGGGRDSMTELALAEDGRLLVDDWPLALEDLSLVVFSDPGYEWPLTYKAIEVTKEACRKAGIPFYYLAAPSLKDEIAWAEVYDREWKKAMKEAKRRGVKKWWEVDGPPRNQQPWRQRKYRSIEEKAAAGGYHERPRLLAEMRLRGRVTSFQTPECTISQKILPIRELVSDLCVQRYGMDLKTWGDLVYATRDASGANKVEPHRMLIGFAKGEEGRAGKWNPAKGVGVWGVKEVYPLIDMEIDKHEESRILKDRGWGWVHKSGCVGCHFSPTSWYWMVKEEAPEVFAEMVATESHATATRKKLGPPGGRSPMYMTGSEPLAEDVASWGSKPGILKIQFSIGNLPRSFIDKLARIDGYFRLTAGGNWAGQSAASARRGEPFGFLSADTLPSRHDADKTLFRRHGDLKAELKDLLLSKGYERGCGFGQE